MLEDYTYPRTNAGSSSPTRAEKATNISGAPIHYRVDIKY